MRHRVAVVPGAGTGKEVFPEALRVLKRAGEAWLLLTAQAFAAQVVSLFLDVVGIEFTR